jgi:hypothetical protein
MRKVRVARRVETTTLFVVRRGIRNDMADFAATDRRPSRRAHVRRGGASLAGWRLADLGRGLAHD